MPSAKCHVVESPVAPRESWPPSYLPRYLKYMGLSATTGRSLERVVATSCSGPTSLEMSRVKRLLGSTGWTRWRGSPEPSM